VKPRQSYRTSVRSKIRRLKPRDRQTQTRARKKRMPRPSLKPQQARRDLRLEVKSKMQPRRRQSSRESQNLVPNLQEVQPRISQDSQTPPKQPLGSQNRSANQTETARRVDHDSQD